MIKIFIIDKDSADQRLDKFLKRNFDNLSQSFIEKNLRKKNILLNQHLTKSNQIIKTDDKITIKNFSEEIYNTVLSGYLSLISTPMACARWVLPSPTPP